MYSIQFKKVFFLENKFVLKILEKVAIEIFLVCLYFCLPNRDQDRRSFFTYRETWVSNFFKCEKFLGSKERVDIPQYLRYSDEISIKKKLEMIHFD